MRAQGPVRLLGARGMARNGRLTVACALLFAHAPEVKFPKPMCACCVTEEANGARARGSSFLMTCGSKVRCPGRSFRHETSSWASSPSGGGSPTTASSLICRWSRACLEGIVNAVVHRSYSLAGDNTRVEIFEDRIEVTSPGRFPGLVGMAEPQAAPRFARNPRIARVCADLDFGQELGEGIRRIFEKMRLAGLSDPLYRQNSGAVHTELSRVPADRKLDALLPFDHRISSPIFATRSG